MEELDLFDLNRPLDLYRLVHDAYNTYVREPTERDFFFLALALTHLREWISESDHREIQRKRDVGAPLTAGEVFYEEIYQLESFRIIMALCNRGKHHITSVSGPTTGKAVGLIAGIARAGDSLGQTHFLIDGRDSRDHFIELIGKYNDWFDKNSN